MDSDVDRDKIIKAAEFTTKKNEKLDNVANTAKELLENNKNNLFKRQSNEHLEELNELENNLLEIKNIILEGKKELPKMKEFEVAFKNYKLILKDKIEDFSQELMLKDTNFSYSLEQKGKENSKLDFNTYYTSNYEKMKNSCIKFGFLNLDEKSFKYGEMLEILKSGKRKINNRINDINENNKGNLAFEVNDIGKNILASNYVYSTNLLCKELDCNKSKLTNDFLSEEKEFHIKKLDYLVSKYKYNEELLKKVKKIRKEKLSLERSLHKSEEKENVKNEKFYDFVEKSIQKPGNYDYRKISFIIMKKMDMDIPKIDKHCNILQLIDNHLKNIKKGKSMELH